MSYFSLDYLGFHQIAYAHAMTVEDYHFSFSTEGFGIYRERESETSGLIEIGYVVKNPLVIENHTLGETYVAGEGDVFIFPPNHNLSVHSRYSGEHKHITTEYMIDARVEIHRGEDVPGSTEADSGRSICLPYRISADRVDRTALSRIHKVAADHTLLIRKSYFRQASEFCSLLEALRKTSDPAELERGYFSPKSKANCKKAEEYIESHILQPIQIQDIADAVGISKNYLITIFPQYKGMGLIEYINRIKLNRIILMMTRYGYSMKQSCELVGYSDVNYVSRIFRKYYGVPLTEYLKMTFSVKSPAPESSGPKE